MLSHPRNACARIRNFPAGVLFSGKNSIMYQALLHSHSLLRYFVLIALVVVIVKSLMGLMNKGTFGKWDNKFSLYLMIFTHLQLLVGLVLYFVSPWVKFSGEAMSEKLSRYWTVEHIFGMIVAVTLITIARVSLKRMTSDQAKFRRLFIFNLIALLVIVTVLYMSGRGLLSMSVS